MIDKHNDKFLRHHYKGKFLNYLKNFVECWFIPGYGYAELPRIVKELKESESSSYCESLLREMKLVMEIDDWDYVQEFVYKHGLRQLSAEKLKAMVELLIKELSF